MLECEVWVGRVLGGALIVCVPLEGSVSSNVFFFLPLSRHPPPPPPSFKLLVRLNRFFLFPCPATLLPLPPVLNLCQCRRSTYTDMFCVPPPPLPHVFRTESRRRRGGAGRLVLSVEDRWGAGRGTCGPCTRREVGREAVARELSRQLPSLWHVTPGWWCVCVGCAERGVAT